MYSQYSEGNIGQVNSTIIDINFYYSCKIQCEIMNVLNCMKYVPVLVTCTPLSHGSVDGLKEGCTPS